MTAVKTKLMWNNRDDDWAVMQINGNAPDVVNIQPQLKAVQHIENPQNKHNEIINKYE